MLEETHYTILTILEANPRASQRDIARELNVSVGKVNYCLRALIEKGLVKANRFRRAENRAPYLYKLTPKGISAKTRLSVKFLKQKIQEYDALKQEIETLKRDIYRSRTGMP